MKLGFLCCERRKNVISFLLRMKYIYCLLANAITLYFNVLFLTFLLESLNRIQTFVVYFCVIVSNSSVYLKEQL